MDRYLPMLRIFGRGFEKSGIRAKSGIRHTFHAVIVIFIPIICISFDIYAFEKCHIPLLDFAVFG